MTPSTPRNGFSWRTGVAVFVTVTLALLSGGFWYYRAEAEEIFAEILVEARYRAGVMVVIVGSLILLAAVTTVYGYQRKAARVLRDSQRALRESDERLRLVFTSTNLGLYDFDVQTGACVVSPEYARMLGYDPAELRETRATWYERLHPDDREEVDRVNEECLAGRCEDYSVEFRQRTRDGDWKWILSVGKLVSRSVDGRPLRIVGTHSDITQRKLAELRLAESENRYRDLVEHSQDLICTHTLDGSVISVNEAACRLTGYSREVLLQMNMADLLVPQARHLFSGYLTEIQATGRADGVLRIQTASGETRTWEYHNTLRTEGVTVPVVRGMSRDVTERARAESELKRRNVFVETLLEHAPIGFAVNTVHDGRPVFISRTFENIYGVPRDSIHSVAEFFEKVYLDPIFREQIRERIMADMATGDAARMRWENIPIATQAGEHKIVTATNIPLLDQNLMISTVQDVTERWQAEAALRDSVERFQLANRATFNVIWDFNPQTNTLWWNDNVEKVFGYRADDREPCLESWTNHIHPEDLERVTAGFHAAVDSGRELWSDEYRFRRKDGSYAEVEDRGYIARDADGRAVRMLGAMQDMTGQRRAEESIRVQAHMLNNIGQAVIATDTEGTVTYANRFAGALYGWSPADMLGQNILEVLVPQTNHEQTEQIVARLQRGENWSGEFLVQTRDGRVFPASVTDSPLLDKSGKLVGIVGVSTDITDRKQLEAQFLQAQKMETVGRLAGGVAHDFNNLLTVINGTAELASMRLSAGDPLRADLLHIQEAGERAASLTRQLLAFSRRQIMRQDVLHLGTLVAELRGMLQRLIEEAIDLVVVPATDVGRVRADPQQLEQVIMNLVVNARDAMPAGGTLTIETDDVELDETYAAAHPSVQPGPHVMLAVSDTGIGMDEATRLRIFEPFFTTKNPDKGTGLGLATVYGIVKQSGGSIWVYSDLGRGTTFKIYLPRVDEVADADQPARAGGVVHGTETILVVEDEDALRHVAEGMLQWAGYTVLTASNGGEALLWLERHDGPVHLMLTDVVMPGISGWELAAQLAEARPDIKVLYTSGYTDDAIVRHGVLHSTTHFVGKPYTIEELTRKVREVLDTPAPPATTAASDPAR